MASNYKRRSSSSASPHSAPSTRQVQKQSSQRTGSVRGSGRGTLPGGSSRSSSFRGNVAGGLSGGSLRSASGSSSSRGVSSSSSSRRAPSRTVGAPATSSNRTPSRTVGASATSSYRTTPRSAAPRVPHAASSSDAYVTRTVGEIRRTQERSQQQQAGRKVSGNVIAVLVIVVIVLVGALALYLAPIATIQHISIKGAEHLTEEEMLALAEIPEDTTLLRVDTTQIEQNCLRDAWIKEVAVNRVFPDTLELVVTEREIAATVAVPTESSTVTRVWAIADDKTWLMPIPDKESEAAATVSEQVYLDAESVLQIVDVPYGTSPEIGEVCTDSNVNNALAIVSGMTTELADSVVRVSATDAESTILTLDNGVEIAFGAAEDIREKERVCLALLEEHEGNIAYINVRTVSSPTWRSL